MKFPELVPAIFVHRPNRFIAAVHLERGGAAYAHVPTTGRLTGVLQQGCRVWLSPAANPKRKTPYTLILAELENKGLCSVNATLANRLFAEALTERKIAAFKYDLIEREVSFGRSRLDLRLSEGDQTCWIEIKSVTYVKDGVGMFPDAPTARGRKHMDELATLVGQGDRASIVLIAQREDAESFSPHEAIDPDFSEKLREVHQVGVEVHAYRCAVSLKEIKIVEEIPVKLLSSMKTQLEDINKS
ncbi:MAG: DNA/RNA nuclease SfsA [Chloroflexota bacterium]|nr:DNA/RNA nuclease SfsA [Chloroflexota bacterium]